MLRGLLWVALTPGSLHAEMRRPRRIAWCCWTCSGWSYPSMGLPRAEKLGLVGLPRLLDLDIVGEGANVEHADFRLL